MTKKNKKKIFWELSVGVVLLVYGVPSIEEILLNATADIAKQSTATIILLPILYLLMVLLPIINISVLLDGVARLFNSTLSEGVSKIWEKINK